MHIDTPYILGEYIDLLDHLSGTVCSFNKDLIKTNKMKNE